MPRSRDDLLKMLEEQVGFLERSNEDFDQGHLSEAKRMAVTIRVLLHNTGSSHALISQLDLQDKLTWVATAGRPDPKNLLPQNGIFQMGIDIGEGKPLTRAPLDEYPPGLIRTTALVPRGSRVFFDEWWNGPVTRDSEHTLFSRKEFVLVLCNKEGGAHVDPQVKASYDKIANSNSMGWTYQEGDTAEIPLSSPVPYAVRQISHEVVKSIRDQRDRIK